MIGSDGRDGEARGDDAELGQPVAHHIAHIGALGEARPHSEQRVAGVGPARDPDLAFELLDLDRSGAGEWMVGGDADGELALGERRQLECRGFGIRRAIGRDAGDDREIERARPQGTGERRGGRLAQGDLQLRGQGRKGLRHEPGRSGGERAEPDRPGGGLLAVQLAPQGVELVEDAGRAGQQCALPPGLA